jgi:hypothetical protein
MGIPRLQPVTGKLDWEALQRWLHLRSGKVVVSAGSIRHLDACKGLPQPKSHLPANQALPADSWDSLGASI